jgi:hypothetical protein
MSMQYIFRSVVKYLFPLFILVPIVMFWRGVWGLLDLYFLPEDKTMSYIITTVISFLILLALEVRFNKKGETVLIQTKKDPIKIRLG